MRLIAERLLPNATGTTYVQGELVSQRLRPLPPPARSHQFHLYYSEGNPGAAALLDEFAHEIARLAGLTSRPHATNTASSLLMTSNLQQLTQCDHMLLYLTSQVGDQAHASPHAILSKQS